MAMRRWAAAVVLLVGTLSSGCASRPGGTMVGASTTGPATVPAGPAVRSPGVAAEPVDTSAIPRELVLALVGGGRRPITIRVNQAADEIPPAIHEGWRVVGSSVSGPTSTSVFQAPYSSRTAHDSLKARFERAGWILPANQFRGFDRGFVQTAALAMGMSTMDGYCDGSRYATYHATSRLATEAQVFINLSGASSRCTMSSSAVRYESMMDSMPIPRLMPPADLYVEGGGTSSSGALDWGSTAKATGRLTVAEALGHYAAQLTEQGWAATELAGTGLNVAAQAFTRTYSDKSWFGTLIVSRPPTGSELLLSFRFVRL